MLHAERIVTETVCGPAGAAGLELDDAGVDAGIALSSADAVDEGDDEGAVDCPDCGGMRHADRSSAASLIIMCVQTAAGSNSRTVHAPDAVGHRSRSFSELHGHEGCCAYFLRRAHHIQRLVIKRAMQRRIEPKSLQRRLTDVVIGEVLKTTMHRRDPEDLVTTKYVREAFDAECTLPFELPFDLNSEAVPYEHFEVIVPADDLDTIPFDLIEEHELCASRNLVAVEKEETAKVKAPRRRQPPRRLLGPAMLMGAFGVGFGIGLAFFAL